MMMKEKIGEQEDYECCHYLKTQYACIHIMHLQCKRERILYRTYNVEDLENGNKEGSKACSYNGCSLFRQRGDSCRSLLPVAEVKI